MRSNHVHVVGTGTIGGPLIRYLAELRRSLGIGRLTFAKARPLGKNRPDIERLQALGAELLVAREAMPVFREAGYRPDGCVEDAQPEVTHLLDCTPKGRALAAKPTYEGLPKLVFAAAQGSEKGFGTPYAHGINDPVLERGDRWYQVVSCNTHAGAFILKGVSGGNLDLVREAVLTYVRRASDVSQDGGHELSIKVEKHRGASGTHQGEDVEALFGTVYGRVPPIFSSAAVVPSQLMHATCAHVLLRGMFTTEQVINNLGTNGRIALTEKLTSGEVFASGRDWGGRILNPLVALTPTVATTSRNGDTLVALWGFTPQDANSHWSTLALTAYHLCGEVGVATVDAWARSLIHKEI